MTTHKSPSPSIFKRLCQIFSVRSKAITSKRAPTNSVAASERTDSGTVATATAIPQVPHLIADTLAYLVRHGDHMALYPSSRSPPAYAEDVRAWTSLYDFKSGSRRSSKSYPTPPIAEDESMDPLVSQHTRECAYGAVEVLRVFLDKSGSGPLLSEQAIQTAIRAMDREHPGNKPKRVERRCKAVLAALRANTASGASWSVVLSLVEAFRSLVRAEGAKGGDVHRAAALKTLLDVWPLYFMGPVAFEWMCGRPDRLEQQQVTAMWALLFSAPCSLDSF